VKNLVYNTILRSSLLRVTLILNLAYTSSFKFKLESYPKWRVNFSLQMRLHAQLIQTSCLFWWFTITWCLVWWRYTKLFAHL